MPVIARYALATLTPLVLLLVGATLWGGAAVLALIWLTLIAAGLDHVLAPPHREAEDHAPWSDRLSVALGVGHFVLLALVLVALTGSNLGFGAKLALFLASASFFGQVSHPNAHELIHRRGLALRTLGAAVYTSLGFGHHVSAHRLVHHRHVGTPDDPNTPLPGEGFWAYLTRAWAGSFQAGLACEEARLERTGASIYSPRNPYLAWIGGAGLSLVVAVWIAGLGGALVLITLGAMMGGQILLSDYIQHYGLQRLVLDSGRVEAVAPHHSWNAPRGFSSYLMMNAPAHSEHHMHPDRSYDRLDPEARAPVLPYSMPIMAMLATAPQVWHRVMDRRALRVMEAAQARLARAPEHRQVEPASATPPTETDALLSRVASAARDAAAHS